MTSVSLSFIELLIKGIPEGFLDVLAVFILARIPFNKKKYVAISILFIVITYAIRLLPINYGVNTMLSLFFLVIIFALMMKADLVKLIRSSIILLMTLFICEQINLLTLFAIYGKEETLTLFSNTVTKALASIPSTILLAVAVYLMSVIIKKWDKRKSNIQNQ